MTALTTPADVVHHCPHCLCTLTTATEGAAAPPAPMRCPHCRLIVGAGRAVDAATAAELRVGGAAANVLGSAARREDGTRREPAEVIAQIRAAAAELDCPVDRLRMLDYDELCQADGDMIRIADILATFSTWKQACREAADAA